jgi:hypothetical protein
LDGQTQAVIGVVAPTRMDYAAVCAKLAGFIQAMTGGPPGLPGAEPEGGGPKDG